VRGIWQNPFPMYILSTLHKLSNFHQRLNELGGTATPSLTSLKCLCLSQASWQLSPCTASAGIGVKVANGRNLADSRAILITPS